VGQGGWAGHTAVGYNGKANRRGPRKATCSGHATTAAGFFKKNLVNNLKWRNCKYESCVSQKVMKLCSLQLFHLMPFRALKAIYTWLCII
jgi:hypothetical protein